MRGILFIAQRLFLHHRQRFHLESRRYGHPLFGATLGIALSLLPLIVVDHFAEGMIEGIIARYRETFSYHFQINNSWRNFYQNPDRSRTEWETIAKELSLHPDVKTAWVERRGFALAKGPVARDGLALRALPEDALLRDATFAQYIQFDRGKWDLSGQSILLGRESARQLGAVVGNEILLVTAGNNLNNSLKPQLSRLTVRGIFSTGYQDLDKTWAFISSDTGWTILSNQNSETLIGGKYIGNGYKTPNTTTLLRKSFQKQWPIVDWHYINSMLIKNLNQTKIILLLIMALIALVGVLNVTSSIMMLSLERRREIGILKCVGASPGIVSGAFTLAGLLASSIGIIVGLSGGLLVSYFINPIISGIDTILALLSSLFSNTPPPTLLNAEHYLQEIVVDLRWKITFFIGLGALILSLLAAWLPSAMATKLKPLEVLRKH